MKGSVHKYDNRLSNKCHFKHDLDNDDVGYILEHCTFDRGELEDTHTAKLRIWPEDAGESKLLLAQDADAPKQPNPL